VIDSDSGSRSWADGGIGGDDWPQRPDQLVYQLDRVIALFNRLQDGERIDLLDGLLDCVDWRDMFGGQTTGFLSNSQVEELKRYYRSVFADVERFYLAEQLSTELMTALMVSGDITLSDEFRSLGRDRPHLWNEIRTFFTRKELATALAILADTPSTPSTQEG
jgi:hypothetical protein